MFLTGEPRALGVTGLGLRVESVGMMQDAGFLEVHGFL